MIRIAMLVLNDMRCDARVTREARTLSEAGHDVQVFALRGAETPEVEESSGFAIHRVGDFTRASFRQPLRKVRERRARERDLRDAVIAMRPDVVHCHDSDTLAIGASAADMLGIPYVYDAHELYPDSLQQRAFQGSAPVQAYLRAVERRFVPGAAAVITVSNGVSRVLAERYGVPSEVVANCPDLMPIADRGLLKRMLGLRPDSTVALYQGGLRLGRAIDELIEAISLVPELHLAVQGTGEYEDAMRHQVLRHGVTNRVHFMGHVDYDLLHELTCGADMGTVFLDGVTLNHRVAWTNRMFMYMMAGIPTVATDLPGASEVLLPASAGVLTPPGDVEAMVAALHRLADDSCLRTEIGTCARAAAESEYNWGVQRRRLLKVYDSLSTP